VQSHEHELFASEERVGRLEEVTVTCFVTRLDYSDYELVVYGKVEEKEVSRRQLSIAEVKRIPGLGGEALRIVQAMPGVGRPSFGGNEVIVRGAPGWASRYFIDGVSVPLLYHLGGNTSSYPSEAVEAVDFYPGGFSVRYGGGTGGVIEMRSRKPKTDRVQGYVDLSSLDGAVFAEGPITPEVSFMASGRRGFAGDLLNYYFNEIADPRSVTATAAPFYWDFLLRSDVKVSKGNDLFVQFIGSRDSMGVFVPSMDMGSNEIDEALDQLNMKIQFYTLIAGLDTRLSGRWKNSLRMSASFQNTRLAAFGMATMEGTEYMGYARNQLSYAAGDNLTVNAGADMQFTKARYGADMVNLENNTPMDEGAEGTYGFVGGYLNIEWKPIDKLLLVPGVRYD
jgi:outer membrane receptor protein involved in Fe transport